MPIGPGAVVNVEAGGRALLLVLFEPLIGELGVEAGSGPI